MSDPIARLKAGLDGDEAEAKAWLPFGNPNATQRTHNAARDPGRTLREVAAIREILDKYEATEAACRDTQYSEGMWGMIIARDTWKQAALALATIYPVQETP